MFQINRENGRLVIQGGDLFNLLDWLEKNKDLYQRERAVDRLHRAIDLANGRNEYVKNGEPACVIAHLFILQGGSLEELQTFKHVVDKLKAKFPDYPLSLLRTLQRTWDSYIFANDEERRLAMHNLVNNWDLWVERFFTRTHLPNVTT